MSYGKRDEDADGAIFKVDRTSVFQEARVFNTSPVNPRRCRILLTKIILLLSTGEKYSKNEAVDLFFATSKLFSSKDASLRQMVYLCLKMLALDVEDRIMVTSSIMKDSASNSDVIFRPNSIRTLIRVIDASTVQAIERQIKTAIVDKVPSVSSAALVSSYHLLPVAKDVVRRWQSETQEAASASKSGGGFLGFGGSHSQGLPPTGPNYMTQYHAIGLLYQMRSHDRMALVKMVQQFGAQGVVKSHPGSMLLVRLSAKLAEEDPNLRKPMMQFLDQSLRHKSEMVNFEAAKAICDMPGVTDNELIQTVHTLQLFLTSPRAVTKFAAIRILHTLASFKPDAVRSCNSDIEALVSSSNRSIATFAITTLLKTGNESSVDRLMKQMTGFIQEVSDEFKVTICEAIRTLCLKFPSKAAGMLQFLSTILREEGGYDFKRAVVESIFDLIKFVPESKEEALAQLAEFIEDCEYTKLSVRILYTLATEGPKLPSPTKYIRYIYNRLVLENAIVRAAAVGALGKFGCSSKDQSIRKSVHVLLTRSLSDIDDECRDRAAFYLRLMKDEDESAKKLATNDSMFSLPILEHQLVMYVTSENRDSFNKAFDISNVPIVTREQADAEDRNKKLNTAMPTLKAPSDGPKRGAAPDTKTADGAAAAAAATQKYMEQLSKIPEIAAYGPVLKSSPIVELTESETEYYVTAVKHIFKENIVLQFDIKNTLPDTVLTDVSVASAPADSVEDEDPAPPLEEDFIIPVSKLVTNEPGTAYVAFKRPFSSAHPFTATSFTNVLKFTSREIDPTTNEPEETGYEDEYEVGDLDLGGPDYIVPAFAGSFDNVWSGISTGEGKEAVETLALGNTNSIADATDTLIKTLALQPLDGTDVTLSTSTHELKLFGKTISGGKVAARARMAFTNKNGVTLKIQARSDEVGVAELLIAGVA